MKTVAVMTMVFLPATFFAALFAVPSLDWKADDVIQSNHWVYWAFSIPATVLVFLIWTFLNNRHRLMRLYTKRGESLQMRKNDSVQEKLKRQNSNGWERRY